MVENKNNALEFLKKLNDGEIMVDNSRILPKYIQFFRNGCKIVYKRKNGIYATKQFIDENIPFDENVVLAKEYLKSIIDHEI